MTLPHLNGKASVGLSLGALTAALGIGGKLIADRFEIERQIATLTAKTLRYDEILSGKTREMSAEARELIDALRKRQDETERSLRELQQELLQLERRVR